MGLNNKRWDALALLTFALLLFMLANTDKVYAAPTVLVSPSTVTQGSSFQVSGTGFSTSDSGSVQVNDDPSGACGGSVAIVVNLSSDSSGNVAAHTLSSSSLGVGIHCVTIVLFDSSAASAITVTAPPIPEYPIGLPLLAIIMIVVYGLIKRKIRA